MGLAFFRPEVWDTKPIVEIRAEVVHPADWEHYVHAKLCFVRRRKEEEVEGREGNNVP